MDTTERPSRKPLIFTGIGGLFLGSLIGAGVAGSADATDAAGAPKPAPTVTVTAEPEIVEVEVPGGTPEACLTALDDAEVVFAVASEVMGLTSGLMTDVFPAAVTAAYERDVAGIDKATADLEKFNSDLGALTRKIQSVDYAKAAAECRG